MSTPAPAPARRVLSSRNSCLRLLPLMALCLTLLAGPSSNSLRRGDGLFHGEEALAGKIRGHDEILPPEAVRCSNCHEATSASSLGRSAPLLNRSLLLESRQRRGGPPSRYDAVSFCRLLRKGVDPAFIVIAREMPVYDVDEDQCQGLWSFITTESAPDEKN